MERIANEMEKAAATIEAQKEAVNQAALDLNEVKKKAQKGLLAAAKDGTLDKIAREMDAGRISAEG